MPARTYDDWPAAASGLPIRRPEPSRTVHVESDTGRAMSAGLPVEPPVRLSRDEVDRLVAFRNAVLGLHLLKTPVDPDFVPMCSCGLPARCCVILRAEHEVLGIPMPVQFGSLTRPYYCEA